MTSEQIRQKFLKFFEERGHKIIPSSSLVPEGDSSVLFTTAGMQQFKPYYVGKKSPMSDIGSLNVVSIQKCVRTSDIEEVGDDTHLTFFEMLGNFSFGGYWKRESIQYAYDFITKELGLKIDYVSIFKDDGSGIPADTESGEIWKSIDSSLKIKEHKKEDNFWGPTGEEGPCGPTTEIYINGVEIWNIVFNEFYKTKEGKYEPLETKGVDTGMGLERLLVQVQNKKNVFETDLLSGLSDNRVIADHIRTSVFMIADGVVPSNTERGYILRRLLRRVWVIENKLKLSPQVLEDVITAVIEKYKKKYPDLEKNKNEIINIYFAEWQKFKRVLADGIKEFEKNKDPFVLFTTFGFPLELIKQLAEGRDIKIDEDDFQAKFKAHQEASRLKSNS